MNSRVIEMVYRALPWSVHGFLKLFRVYPKPITPKHRFADTRRRQHPPHLPGEGVRVVCVREGEGVRERESRGAS